MRLEYIKDLIAKAKKNKISVTDLVMLLRIADAVYYNNGTLTNSSKVKDIHLSDKVVTLVEKNITDTIYDNLVELLEEKDPDNAYLNKVGAPVSNASERSMSLPFKMPSLNKVKPDTSALSNFLSKGGPFVISDKVDGVSLGIDPSKKLLFTRGNGSKGQDISHLWELLTIPKNIKKQEHVRAEIVLPKAKFKKWSDSFANPRNMVSGLVNKASKDKTFKHTKILAYSIIGVKPSIAFARLESQGFDTPWWKVVKTITEDNLLKLLELRKSKSSYEIDGLVISRDIAETPSESNPKNSMAFKSSSVEESKQFEVDHVEWNLSKHSYYKPVLVLKPQKLDGVTISRVTCHNASFIVKNKLGPKAVVLLRRSGGVIPFIEKVIKPARTPQMPETDYEWTESKVDILLPKGHNHDDVKLLKISNFFRSIGVEHIAYGIFEKLYDSGLDTVIKIIKAKKSRLLTIDGIQDKTATLIVTQIKQASSNISMPTLLYASGCFPRLLGTTRFELIVEELPDFMNMKSSRLRDRIVDIPSFNMKTANAFIEGLPAFIKFYNKIISYIVLKSPKKKKLHSKKLLNMQFVFSGFRDPTLQQRIEDNGGTLSNTINSKTTVLVMKSIGTGSTKESKAQALEIKIFDVNKFKKWLDIKLK